MATVRLRRYEVEDELLPPVCLKCGDNADVKRRKKFSWYPSWVNILILAGLIPFAIVAMILTKYMTIQAPVCHAHKGHWTWRSLFIWLGLLGCIILGFAAIAALVALDRPGGQRGMANQLAPFVCLGSLGVFVVWLIAAAIVQQTGIRPTEITDRDITLTNVSADFVDALRDERERRDDDYDDRYRRRPRPRRRDWEEEDEQDDAIWDRERE